MGGDGYLCCVPLHSLLQHVDPSLHILHICPWHHGVAQMRLLLVEDSHVLAKRINKLLEA